MSSLLGEELRSAMGAQQRGPIWMAMLFNAVLFSGWAVSLLIPSGAAAAAAAAKSV